MDPPQTLCPGYRQVKSFGPDEDYEEEEEVFYVTLDMGDVEPTLVPSSTSYRLIGLDTPTPYIQLQGTILKGRHDLLLGTEMIFTDDKETHDWNTRSVAHVANTEQRIAFQEVTLIPKVSETTGEGTSNKITVNMDPPPPTEEDSSAQIELMTGLRVPATRRRKSTAQGKAASSKQKGKGKGKGKEKATEDAMDTEDTAGITATQSAQRKGKGKDKAVPQVLDDVPAMDNVQDDDMDDMYVDE